MKEVTKFVCECALISFPQRQNNNLVAYYIFPMWLAYIVSSSYIYSFKGFPPKKLENLMTQWIYQPFNTTCTKKLISPSRKSEIKVLSLWKSSRSFPTHIMDMGKQCNVICGNYCTNSQQRCHPSPDMHFTQCVAKWWKCHLLQIEATKGVTNMV